MVTHHDNIDDTTKKHTHRHKHSEDGEEHEHNHEHSKINHIESKVLVNNSSLETSALIEVDSENGFIEKSFFSTPHPWEIFRPPIA